MNTILVAGIGNIFLGDDAFGVAVVQQMQREPPIDGVRVIDFGIRGMDLAYALLDEEYAAAIFVDAVPRGGSPGTLYVIEPCESDFVAPVEEQSLIDAHSMHPLNVLRLAHSMGSRLRRVFVIGCEPRPFDPEVDLEIEMSSPVRAAIRGAMELVRERIDILKSTAHRLSDRVLEGADSHDASTAAI